MHVSQDDGVQPEAQLTVQPGQTRMMFISIYNVSLGGIAPKHMLPVIQKLC
jgi:hypothetical protein